MRKFSAISHHRSAKCRRAHVIHASSRLSTLDSRLRSATTLTEVLMSLMLMGIGVVTLATLFPISILRTVQATQLTNAAILRFGAETAIELSDVNDDGNYKDLVFDPDGDGNYLEHFSTGRNYVVDPLGWEIMGQDGGTFATFGPLPRWNGVGQNNVHPYSNIPNPLPPGIDFEGYAADLVTLPDSWPLVVDEFPDPGGAPNDSTSVIFPASIDLTGIGYSTAGTPNLHSRVVVFDVTGKFSTVRQIDNIAGQTVSWVTPLPLDPYDLPPIGNNNGQIDVGEIGQVRIETHERRYTWLLTVRNKGGGRAGVDIVTFFNRPFGSTDDEYDYPNVQFRELGPDAAAGRAGVDDDGDGNTDTIGGTVVDNKEIGFAGSDDFTVNVSWTVGTDPQPFYRKGSFVLNTSRGIWYRIQDIQNENTGAGTVDLIVAPVGRGDQNTKLKVHDGDGAMFLRGVIEVYPLGTVAL